MDTGMIRKLHGSALAWLILVNAGVYLLFGLIGIIADFTPALYFALVGGITPFLQQFWGIFTYMFVQTDFLHLLFNMMWLWAFGALMVRIDSGKTLVQTYIVSGVFGGLAFLIATITGIVGSPVLIGSSAAVLGVIAGAAARQPKLRLDMMLLGAIEVRWIALVAILLCGIAPGLGSTPTLLAHLCGAIAGWLFVRIKYHKFHNASHAKKTKQKNKSTNVRQHQKRGLKEYEQAELDTLLEKVNKSGFKSLSMKQRSRLFELSGKINK